jgi:hypothetical protein
MNWTNYIERSPRRQVAGSNPVTPTKRNSTVIFLFRFLGCAPFFFAAAVLMAQDSLPSSLSTTSPAPSAQPQLMPAPLPPPSGEPAVPSPAANIPDLSQLDAVFKQSSMGKEADDIKRHLELRRLENQVVGDPAIVGAKAEAQAAKTDLEKREKLRVYYNLYYGRMGALASTPELKAYVETMKTAHLALTAQPRVRPTPAVAKSLAP